MQSSIKQSQQKYPRCRYTGAACNKGLFYINENMAEGAAPALQRFFSHLKFDQV